MTTIPSLLRTIQYQQDKYQLNVDLTFVTYNTKELPNIKQKSNTMKGADSLERSRDHEFKSNSYVGYVPSPEAPRKYQPPTNEPLLNPKQYKLKVTEERKVMREEMEKAKQRNFEVKYGKVAAQNRSAVTFDYYGLPEQKDFTSKRFDSQLNFITNGEEPRYEDLTVFIHRKHIPEQSNIAAALQGMSQAPVFYPSKMKSEYSLKPREFDIAAPWRKAEDYSKPKVAEPVNVEEK